MNIRILPLLLLLFAGAACAQQGFATLDEYLNKLTGHEPSQLLSHTADVPSTTGSLVVGFVQVRPELENKDSQAWVFVAEKSSTGQILEVARSTPFGFWSAKNQMYVEIVEAKTDSRFSIQINYSGACSNGFDIYRFAKRDQTWVVSGLDSSHYRCGEGDDGAGDARLERSANFLSGQVIEVVFRQGKFVSRTSKRIAYPRYPLSQFNPFNKKYGPR